MVQANVLRGDLSVAISLLVEIFESFTDVLEDLTDLFHADFCADVLQVRVVMIEYVLDQVFVPGQYRL